MTRICRRRDRDRLSLIEASERRWTVPGSLVYEKGMLVAFLFDLALNRVADCRVPFDNLYAELFRRAATGQGSANETIIDLLSERAQLKSFAKDYVESAGNIELGLTALAIRYSGAARRFADQVGCEPKS